MSSSAHRFVQAIADLKSRSFEEEVERPIFRAGKFKSWLSFEFRIATECYDLDDRQKIQLVKYASGGYLKNLTQWKKGGQHGDSVTFDEFCDSILKELESVYATPEKLMFEFMKICKEEDESNEDYVCKLMQYSHYMEFVSDDVENRLFLSAILENSDESDLRQYAVDFLRDKKYNTLKSTDLKSKMISKARFVDEMNRFLSQAEYEREKKRKVFVNQHHQPTWKFCTCCGKHGHDTKSCRYLNS